MRKGLTPHRRSVLFYWMLWGLLLIVMRSAEGLFPAFKRELWGVYILCTFLAVIILCEVERLQIVQYLHRHFPEKAHTFFGKKQHPNIVEMLGYLITNYSFEDEQLKADKQHYRRLMLFALALCIHYPIIGWYLHQ